MIGRTNVVIGGGGSSGSYVAILNVYYPSGSTCQISQGSKIIKAPTTGGVASFGVPSLGEWTVSCTDGTDSDATTVEFTEAGEILNVELTYRFYIYRRGNQYTDITGGYQGRVNNSNYGGTTIGSENFTIRTPSGWDYIESTIHTKALVPITGYKTLHCISDGSMTAGAGYGNAQLGVYASVPSSAAAKRTAQTTLGDVAYSGPTSLSWNQKETILDISSLENSAYAVGVHIRGYSNCWITVYELWLK